MEEKFKVELKQIIEFDSLNDIVESFCDFVVNDFRSSKPGKLTNQNINHWFSNFINEIVCFPPYDGMKLGLYQAQVENIPGFLDQCVVVFDRLKKENLQFKKDQVERIKNDLEKAQNELIHYE